jgi:hypothetical protein
MRVLINVTTGSHGYGLNIPTSDFDTRGVFCSEKLGELFGLHNKTLSIKSTDNDGMLWELVHFFNQLKSGSVKTLELLFSDTKSILQLDDQFDKLVLQNKFKFINTNRIVSTTFGHGNSQFDKAIGAENKLTTEQKDSIAKYGYSPKNAVDCMRLFRCGLWMLTDNIYHVKIIKKSTEFHKQLMDIRTCPDKYTIDDVRLLMKKERSDFEVAVNERDTSNDLTFDEQYAIDVIKQIYINE